MARKFSEVLAAIKEVAPETLKEKLERSVGFWAPEAAWENLSEMVNKYVEPSSKDETSIAVYAALCGCTKDEMKSRFEADNL